MPHSPSSTWRLLDTGLRSAAENIALNRTLLEGRRDGITPNTLRFLRFEPSALVGFHQDVDLELNRERCEALGVAIQRRITGGGAIYFDPGQLGWELYFGRGDLGVAEMDRLAERICQAAAAGISRLGVEAQFRPRNDIEVGGRKLSGTGGVSDGEAVLYQGTLLIDFDIERMLQLLRTPAEKLSDKAISSARERVTSLAALLQEPPPLEQIQRALSEGFAEALEIELEAGKLSAAENGRLDAALVEIDSEEWIFQHRLPSSGPPLRSALHRARGGLIRAAVAYDPERNYLKQLWLTGDFFVQPRRRIPDLEAALKESPMESLEVRVETFFRENPTDTLGLTPADFITAIRNAVASDG